MPKPPGCEPVSSLAEASSGCFRVVTATGTVYEVDLDQHTLLRRPARGLGMPGLMLRDEAPVTLLHILVCTVGAQGRFVVDLRQFGAGLTTRATATVIEIARLDHNTPAGGGTT